MIASLNLPIPPKISGLTAILLGAFPSMGSAAEARVFDFDDEILPILEDHCYNCHGDGTKKGKVSFDTFSSFEELLGQDELWVHALKNVRAGMMPPAKKKRLSDEELSTLETWIKQDALKLDPENPDPGRVTLRRLNRAEYKNTIRDLMGIEFRTEEEFPADDTGYGFDNIGDVLTTSPMLMEKYMKAAEAIVAEAVPKVSRVTPGKFIGTSVFDGRRHNDEMSISLYDATDLKGEVEIDRPGTYRITLNSQVRGSFAFDPGRADVAWYVNGSKIFEQPLKWESSLAVEPSIELKLEKGRIPVRLTLTPLLGLDEKPSERGGDGAPSVTLRVRGIDLEGPLEAEFSTRPRNYDRFFTREDVPTGPAERRIYTEEILRRFTARAFRQPADETTIRRLADLADDSEHFETGIARAFTATLASPRFLFRMEEALPASSPEQHPLLDEYALASRLSYFLWSSMPDEELFQLAERGELRAQLHAQVKRMLDDPRSNQFVSNFAGQWLQTRDVESVSIDARVVQARDSGDGRKMQARYEKYKRLSREIDEAAKGNDEDLVAKLRLEMDVLRSEFRRSNGRRVEFSGELRTAMRREAEMLFRHLLHENGSILELIDTDQTFLNEPLAKHYGIPDVEGRDMRLVKIPADSPRGGIITMGSVLSVTSNPTRTSPVKRGLFILENILGTPPPPAPPNIPSLEASEHAEDGTELTLRQALARHREDTLCSSCHNRMDPLGLALENFNAMGHWREEERGQPLESPAGQLITGEKFADVNELKKIIVTDRRSDFYHCMTEKLMTYALGRGPEACDITTVDEIVAELEQTNGQFSTLILGVIESVPFQKRRRDLP